MHDVHSQTAEKGQIKIRVPFQALDRVGGAEGVAAFVKGVLEVVNAHSSEGEVDYGDYESEGSGSGVSLFGGSNPGASTAGGNKTSVLKERYSR